MANKVRISYKKDELLGRGRYGAVFKGELVTEKGIKVQVAVKRVPRDELLSSEKPRVKKSKQEPEDRELVNQLKLGRHPNVVQLLHCEDQGEDFRYYALELCELSLYKAFKDLNKYRILLPNPLEFMLQLSLGLEYIHNQNLIHRDIKPENVLISKSSDGTPLVKWGDFGLSKEITKEECTMSGPKGTSLYWAPEIWKMWQNDDCTQEKNKTDEKVVTIMSDIFSSGCVFFEFCTDGTHPFGDGEPQIKNNLSREPSIPSNLIKGHKLEKKHFAYKIISRMLIGSPKARPNLSEIILSFSSLQKMIGMKMMENLKTEDENGQMEQNVEDLQASLQINGKHMTVDIDDVQQQLETTRREFHSLCSNMIPSDEEVDKIADIVANDSVCLVNMVDDGGYSSLILMCRKNRNGSLIKCIKALFRTPPKNGLANEELMKLDVNYQDRSGFNALHYLCNNTQNIADFLEILQLMKEYGIDLNKTDKEVESNALQLLFQNNYKSKASEVVEIVQALLDIGIDINHKNMDGWTALHYLCGHYGHSDLIKIAHLLKKNRVDVTATACDEACWTALHVFCRYYPHENVIEVAKLFIDNRADVNAKLSDGWNVLHQLCRYYNHANLIEVIKFFIDNSVDVTAKSIHGLTTLHLLCVNYTHSNLIDILKLLIDNGVDVYAKDCDERTALTYLLLRDRIEPNLIEAAKFLVARGLDVTGKDPDGCTLIHILCREYAHENLPEIVKFLIENGVEVTAKIVDGNTALHFLCRCYTKNNLIEVVELLIGRGIDVAGKIITNEWTALLVLCRHYPHENLLDIAKLLIENGADANAKNSFGLTALHLLCQCYKHDNFLKVAKFLIEKGVDVTAIQSDGCTALHLLCQHYIHNNLIEVAKCFIDNGTDVSAKNCDGSTAIHMLFHHSNHENLIEVAEFFMERGVDITSRKSDGSTVLHLLFSARLCHRHYITLCRQCIHDNFFKVASFLIGKGVDVNAKQSQYMCSTALHQLCQYYNHENLIKIIQLFISNGVDVGAKDIAEQTPLHILCENNSNRDNLIEVAKLLIETGIDVAAKDSYGRNALHLICSNYRRPNFLDVAKLLIDNGANVKSKNRNGWTPLHLLCTSYRHENLEEIIRFFIDEGLDVYAVTEDERKNTALDFVSSEWMPYKHGNKSKVLELLSNENNKTNT